MRIMSVGNFLRVVPPEGFAAGIARHRQTFAVAGLALGFTGAACVAAHLYAVALVPFLVSRTAFALTRIAPVGGSSRDALCDACEPIAFASLPFAFALAIPGSALAAGFLLFAFLSWLAASRSAARHDAIRFLPASAGTAALVAACAAPAWFGVVSYLAGIVAFVAVGLVIGGTITSKEP